MLRESNAKILMIQERLPPRDRGSARQGPTARSRETLAIRSRDLLMAIFMGAVEKTMSRTKDDYLGAQKEGYMEKEGWADEDTTYHRDGFGEAHHGRDTSLALWDRSACRSLPPGASGMHSCAPP